MRIWEAMRRVAPAQRRRVLRTTLNAFRPGAADRVEKMVAILNARGTHLPTAMREALARELAATTMSLLTPRQATQRIRAAQGAGAPRRLPARLSRAPRPRSAPCARCGGSGKVTKRHPGDVRLLVTVKCRCRSELGGLGLFGPSGVTWPIPIDPFMPYNAGSDGPQWSSARQAYKRVKARVARFGTSAYPRWGAGLPKWNRGLPKSGKETPSGMGLFDPRRPGVYWPEPPEDRPYVTGIIPWSRSLALAPKRPGIGGLGAVDVARLTPEDITSWSCDPSGQVFARIRGGAKVPASRVPASAFDAELRKGLAAVQARCGDPKRAQAEGARAARQSQIQAAANLQADRQYAKRMEKYSAANLLKQGLKETTADIVGGATSVVTSVGGGIFKGLAPLLIPVLAVGLGVMYLMRRASAPTVHVGGR